MVRNTGETVACVPPRKGGPMSSPVITLRNTDSTNEAWRDFRSGMWNNEINVRDFIQQNVTPYNGDETFLAGPSQRTQAIWQKLQAMFPEEWQKGVFDISQIPSSITAHAAGYIDREKEII